MNSGSVGVSCRGRQPGVAQNQLGLHPTSLVSLIRTVNPVKDLAVMAVLRLENPSLQYLLLQFQQLHSQQIGIGVVKVYS